MSNIFKIVFYDHLPPKNIDVYPTVKNHRTIQRTTNASTIEQRNKWESAENIRGQILAITLLPFPRLGAIILLEIGPKHNKNVYCITLGILPACTCPNFVNMAISAIGGQQQYVN